MNGNKESTAEKTFVINPNGSLVDPRNAQINPEKVLTTLRTHVAMQAEIQDKYTPVLEAGMSANEAFDLIPQIPSVDEFIRNIQQLSYCPPEEWNTFRMVAKGRLNELVARDLILSRFKRKGILLEEASNALIIQTLCPDAKCINYGQDYGYSNYSIVLDQSQESAEEDVLEKKPKKKNNLPSPEFILVRPDLSMLFYVEASTQRSENYWGYKVNTFAEFKQKLLKSRAFRDLRELMKDCYCHLALTTESWDKGYYKKTDNPDPSSHTGLPYSSKQYDQYFKDILPVKPPHDLYTQASFLDLPPHWSRVITVHQNYSGSSIVTI